MKLKTDKEPPEENPKVEKPTCADCNKEFTAHYDLIRHVKQNHPNGKAYKCNECGARFSNTQALCCHKRVVSATKLNHVCEFCSKSFIWKSLLSRHLSVHSSDRPYSCINCKKTFKTKGELQKHLKQCSNPQTEEDNQYSCTFCDKTYKYNRGLQRHLFTHSKDKSYYCTLCDKYFKRKDVWENHKKTHVKLKPKVSTANSLAEPHVCKYCSKTFDFESLLKYHLRVHTGDRPFSCSKCNRTYIRQKDLNKHLKKGHGRKGQHTTGHHHRNQKTSAAERTCTNCSRIFDRRSLLEKHLRVHSGEQVPFTCSICGYAYERKYDLKQHLNGHLEQSSKTSTDTRNRDLSEPRMEQEEPKTNNTDKTAEENICKFCSKTFKRSVQLKSHLKQHSVEESTLKTSLPKIALKKALNIKENVKNITNTCKYCSKTFNRISHLVAHLRVHSEERPFPCSLCEMTFKDKATLNKHQNTHVKLEKEKSYKDSKVGNEIRTISTRANCSRSLKESQGDKKNIISTDKRNLNKSKNTPIKQEQSEFDKYLKKSTEQAKKSDLNKPYIKQEDNGYRKYRKTEPNVCEFCSKVFKRSLQFKLHLKEHTEDKHECKFCFKNFSSLSQLEIHLRLHIGERLFSCSLCEKTFQNKSSLNKHQKIHENQKNVKLSNEMKTIDIKETKLKSTEVNNPERTKTNKKNKSNRNVQLSQETKNLKNIQYIQNEIPIEIEADVELSSQSYNSPNEKNIRIISPPTKPKNVIFKPQFYRGLNRYFKVQDPEDQRCYPCFLCEKSYTEIRLLKEHQKIHLKHKSKTMLKTSQTKKSQTIGNSTNDVPCLESPNNRNEETNINIKQEPESDLDYLPPNIQANGLLATIKTETDEEETALNSAVQKKQSKSFNGDLLTCQFCYILFSNHEILREHIKLHLGERVYSCTLCERSYSNKIDLSKHKKFHLKQ